MHSKMNEHKIIILIICVNSYTVDQRLCMSTEEHSSLEFTYLSVSLLIHEYSVCSHFRFIFSPVLLKYHKKQNFKEQYVKLLLLQSEMLKLFIALFRASISMLLDH